MHSRPAFESQQQQHRRGLSLSSSVASDRDDDLTLFREMQRREREYKPFIPEEPGMQTPRTGHKSLDQSLHRIPASSTPIKSYGADDLFSSDWGKNDYDWLMTPPGTPLFLPVDHDPVGSGVSRGGAASVRSALKTSKLGNSKSEPPSRAEHQSKSVRGNLGLQPLNVNSIGSASSSMSAKPVLSGVPRSSAQGVNPAVQHSVPSPTHMLRHAPVGAISSSRPPSSRASAETPQATTQNGGAHAATPSARTSIPYGRPACFSRPSTPVKRSPSPSHPCNPPTTLVRCASANRASSLLSKGATFSRPCSPTSKAWFPEALHGFSQERPPNLRTSMPDRSLSNSRSSTSKICQVEQSDTGVRSRRQSSSSAVARGPTSAAALQNGGKVSHMNAELDGSAAEMPASKLGVKAVREKKPTMCSQEVLDPHVKKPVRSTPLRDVKSIFSSMRESSALGRNPSKKSLDLTLRHMDICKGTPQKIRSFMSSMSKPRGLVNQGVNRSGNNGTRSTSSVMDSPMATSSSTSSEHNMSIVIDPEGSELGDESISEKGSRSSAASQHDLFLLGKEKRISTWLRSPDYRDDDADIMQIFEQEGLESLCGPESPLISELDGTIECDNFCLDPI